MRYENNSDNTKWIIVALTVVIIVLIGIIAYYFWLGPTYGNFILGKQQEAYNIGAIEGQKAVLIGIKSSLIQFGFVQITFDDNQTVYLAPFDPNQVNQQANPGGIPLV